jgi:hypothetical protein
MILVVQDPPGGETMAKKKATPVQTTVTEAKTSRPVRLDLTNADHDRLERIASVFGLSKSSYVRMKLLKAMKADEENEGLK